jgi:hypothetical protein
VNDNLSEALKRMFEETAERLDRHLDVPDGYKLVYDTTPLTVTKATAYVPVSCCQLTDATGENHCTHEPYVPTPRPRAPWYRRLRWWLRGKRQQLGRRVGSWLVGERLLTRDEWDEQREDDW